MDAPSSTYRVARNESRYDARVRNPQAPHTVYPQLTVDDAASFPLAHSGRACGMVQRLESLPDDLPDLCIRALVQVTVEPRLGLGADMPRVRKRLSDGTRQAYATHEHTHVVLRPEVAWVDERRVERVRRAQPDRPLALRPSPRSARRRS
jgi:hypothetical protein